MTMDCCNCSNINTSEGSTYFAFMVIFAGSFFKKKNVLAVILLRHAWLVDLVRSVGCKHILKPFLRMHSNCKCQSINFGGALCCRYYHS